MVYVVDIWFTDFNCLIKYIKEQGRLSFYNNNSSFFDKCICADYLYARNWDKSLHCIIDEDSLCFDIANTVISKDKIRSIQINHQWSYDKLIIKLRDGTSFNLTCENKKIKVRDNNIVKEYALCKLDFIEIGL